MKVKVEYIGHIKEIIKSGRTEELDVSEGASLGDLLLRLSEKYGEPFKRAVYALGDIDVKSNFLVTVNGYTVNQLEGLKTKLKDGDNVILTSVVSGG